jgi:hypothetical protein
MTKQRHGHVNAHCHHAHTIKVVNGETMRYNGIAAFAPGERTLHDVDFDTAAFARWLAAQTGQDADLAFEPVRGGASCELFRMTHLGARPEGFLVRQVDRWMSQLAQYRTRELPGVDLAIVLEGSYAKHVSGKSQNPTHKYLGFTVDQLLLRAQRFAV